MLDTSNATRALGYSLLNGTLGKSELIDSVSDAGFSAPLLSIAALPLDRRTFLKTSTMAACAAACLGCRSAAALETSSTTNDDARFRVEARFYEKLPGKNVHCKLCPRGCMVGDGGRGYCRVRENRGGTYYTLVHSRV